MLTLERVAIRLEDFALAADLSVAEGARVAIIGPSGAGKSTLLAAIGGFAPISHGRLLWRGAAIGHLPPARRPVATIFQDNNLFPHLTVAANVGLGLAPNARLGAADRARVAETLASVGLEGLGARKPGSLSGGQQSRVALARAALQDRPVMLLDEPFAALGPALKVEMIDLVIRLAHDRGATLLMVTHDPGDARQLGGETILVAEGRARPPVPTTQLLENPPDVLRDYLG